LTAVSIVANIHCINLLLHIPLKSANRHFTLFKVITVPTLISPDKFAQYIVDFSYFGLQVNQRAYLMLTETDYNHCKKSSITICPAVTSVHSAQTMTCLSSLFSRVQILIVSADENCFFSTEHLLFNTTEIYGFSTFQRGTGFHYDVPTHGTRYTAR